MSPLSRRHWLACLTATSTLPWLSTACASRFVRRSDAWSPWHYPDPSLPPVLQVVQAATLAASPHNTQPWRFIVDDDQIIVLRDTTRWLGPMDPLSRELHIGLGCAIENAAQAAHAMQRSPRIHLRAAFDHNLDLTGTARPGLSHPDAVAVLTLDADAPDTDLDIDLHAVVADRRTHRGAWSDAPLPGPERRALTELAQAFEPQGVGLRLLTKSDEQRRFADATLAATRAIVADTEMNEASDRWFRYTRADIERHRDGVTLEAQGLPDIAIAAARLAPRPSADKAGGYWIANTERQLAATSAVVLLGSEDRTHLGQQLLVGRLYQRMALWLEAHGYAAHPINQLAERVDRELETDSEEATRALTAIWPDRHAQMLFRVGIPEHGTAHSPRRPVSELVATPC